MGGCRTENTDSLLGRCKAMCSAELLLNLSCFFPNPQLYFTQVEFLATLFLMASLAGSLLVVSLFRFRLRRPYGLYLVAFYMVFLVVAILAELQIFNIHIDGVLENEL